MVVDDEPLARRGLEELLRSEVDVEVTMSTGNAPQALTTALAGVCDLIFLDIRMPELDGMEFLRRLRIGQSRASAGRTYVVLTTAFDQYAVQAFEYEALDYLVKPFSDERFRQSLSRARCRIDFSHSQSNIIERSTDCVALTTRHGIAHIQTASICWIEATGHYVTVHATARSYLSRGRISDWETKLAESNFLRVHRNALVNRAHIVAVHAASDHGRTLKMRDGSEVVVSRRRWAQLKPILTSPVGGLSNSTVE